MLRKPTLQNQKLLFLGSNGAREYEKIGIDSSVDLRDSLIVYNHFFGPLDQHLLGAIDLTQACQSYTGTLLESPTYTTKELEV